MSATKAPPAFGGKVNNTEYYAAVDSIVRVLRPTSSLRTMAQHLNTAGFLSPTGLVWNRDRVANYLRRFTH